MTQESLFSVSVQPADFDTGAEIAALASACGDDENTDVGAIASFVGKVRGGQRDGLSAMTLEHYPGMTEKSLAEIVANARQRWALLGVRVIHRIGKLLPGENIVLVIVCSRHRGDAFAACEFIMDYLKTQAPFWKKEQTPEGSRWVDARDSDETALGKWQ